MNTVGDPERTPAVARFDRPDQLGWVERGAVVALVIVAVTADAVSLGTATSPNYVGGLISIAATLTLAAYAYSPLMATIVLGGVMVAAIATGNAADIVAAAAFAALLVVRLGTTPLILSYIGGLLISGAAISSGIGAPAGEPASVTVLLALAAISGLVGLFLRLASIRRLRLEAVLAEQEAKEREAVLAERRWIAGELHDSIAHHLTVVSLHSQMLDDERTRSTSAEVVRMAALKALNDLRFVIALAEDIPKQAQDGPSDLTAAVEEALDEFQATGLSATFVGDTESRAISRATEIIFARILRESATNILKYAGPGEVRIVLDVQEDFVNLRISNGLPDIPRRELPSTGTGLNRMAERVLGVKGEFTAGQVGDEWVVSASLPSAL